MFYYRLHGKLCVSYTALDLPPATAQANEALTLLTHHDPRTHLSWHRPSAPSQVLTPSSLDWIDPTCHTTPPLDAVLTQALTRQNLSVINTAQPRWQNLFLASSKQRQGFRVHLIAVGDVGSTFVTGLKLLGGGLIDTIGLLDLNEQAVARWVQEFEQVDGPHHPQGFPTVEAIEAQDLFNCDVVVFAASRAIPPVGSEVSDVRMAQFEANRPLVERFARQARACHFKGLFMVLSDPVDPLCQAAFDASNRNEHGQWDGDGLFSHQVQGFGLGVMQARARAAGRRLGVSSPENIRAFGPHGEGLVVVNDFAHYDDALSQTLSQHALCANKKVRELGFKPYLAPALSSGALQLLAALQGHWHESSVCMDGIWFGVRNRFTVHGVEIATAPLPTAVVQRFHDTAAQLQRLIKP